MKRGVVHQSGGLATSGGIASGIDPVGGGGEGGAPPGSIFWDDLENSGETGGTFLENQSGGIWIPYGGFVESIEFAPGGNGVRGVSPTQYGNYYTDYGDSDQLVQMRFKLGNYFGSLWELRSRGTADGGRTGVEAFVSHRGGAGTSYRLTVRELIANAQQASSFINFTGPQASGFPVFVQETQCTSSSCTARVWAEGDPSTILATRTIAVTGPDNTNIVIRPRGGSSDPREILLSIAGFPLP